MKDNQLLTKKRFSEEEVEKMIYSATIRLSDSFEVKIRELTQKRTVTEKEVADLIVTNWDTGHILYSSTVVKICNWLKELGIEVQA